MKVALVTTPRSVHSGIGDYTRHLLPYLQEHCEVRLFVDPKGELAEDEESVDSLVPSEHDRILYQLGNEQHHGFMARMVRALGGTVMQHDWVLFDLAMAAYPGLARGGGKGHLLALREGGLDQLRRYSRNWVDRKRQRDRRAEDPDPSELDGVLLSGWHGEEPAGRWVADRAVLRLPARGCSQIAVTVSSMPGRRVRLVELGQTLAELDCTKDRSGDRLVSAIRGLDEPLLAIETEGVRVAAEQRQNGDPRRLGSFVEKIEWEDGNGWHEVDLSLPPALPIRPISLSRDRFELPFNRSIVRFADAFLVHSEYVKRLILSERNANTPVGVLPHGAERRWSDEDRHALRRRLELPEEFHDAFLVVSFGGVQRHKRVEPLLRGLALARRKRPEIRLMMAGGWHPDDLDPVALARQLGLSGAVHFTGFVPEERAWDAIACGEVNVNLRGPTSGGTSGGIYQALAFGRAIVATDAAEQSELPDSCILKVPLGEGEVEGIADALVRLASNPEELKRLEEGARRYVDEECHWSHTAKRYAEFLEEFPGPRATRRGLVSWKAGRLVTSP